MINRATEFLDVILEKKLLGKSNLNVIDGTLGNGIDSLKILKLMDSRGFLTGFDIQDIAIENSETLLKANGFENYKLINDSHENFGNYFSNESADLIIYNLGYLPKGDKKIFTVPKSTLNSLNSAFNIIKKLGLIILVTYPGYEEGAIEHLEVKKLIEKIDQKYFNVFHGEFINQKNDPPNLFIIEKR